MKLKKVIKRIVTEEQLQRLEKTTKIETKELTQNGYYVVTYARYERGSYEEMVNKLVKDRYSDSEEFAILRKSINNPYNSEFIEYNNYVEQCKLQAKAFIEERENVANKK